MLSPTSSTLSERIPVRCQNLTTELHISEPQKEFIRSSNPIRERVNAQSFVVYVSGVQSLTKEDDCLNSELRVILQTLK
jgi:hypothetical protein